MKLQLSLLKDEKAKKELDILINQIQSHSYSYYVEDNPNISDSEFDELYKQLVNIESQYPELITSIPLHQYQMVIYF